MRESVFDIALPYNKVRKEPIQANRLLVVFVFVYWGLNSNPKSAESALRVL